VKCSQSNAEAWQRNYDKLKQWLAQPRDNFRYPQRKSNEIDESARKEEETLNNWVHNQRHWHRKGGMPAALERHLYGLPKWRWADNHLAWHGMYQEFAVWCENVQTDEALGNAVVKLADSRGGANQRLAKLLREQRGAFQRKGGQHLSAYQLELMTYLDREGNGFFDFCQKYFDLGWDVLFSVLEWWGGMNPEGVPLQESIEGLFDDLPYDVDHKEHGWVHLGHFYFWTKRAAEDHRRGVPVRERRNRMFYPKELTPSQLERFEPWEASRQGLAAAPERRGGKVATYICADVRRRD